MENSQEKDSIAETTIPSSEHDVGEIKISQEFKTPSFIIPSKRKVQKTSGKTDDVFKSPESKSKPEIDPKHGSTINSRDSLSTEISDNEKKVLVTKVKQETDPVTDNSGNVPNTQRHNNDTNKLKGPRLSPAEQLKHSQAAVPYKEPPWSTISDENYSFEVIKNGAVIDKIELKDKAFHVVGRLPSCDIPMEHPSLSRHHAVLQFSNGTAESYPKGWYLFDLDSTHGTWINKNKVPAKKYHRLHVDYVVKYGGSTRLFILHGPNTDREEESELSVAEMKEQRERQLKEAEVLRQAELAEKEKKAELIRKQEEDKGCLWGIDDVEGVDDEDEENPFATLSTENEDLYIDDPKKSLNGYFEREGYDPPQYEFSDAGFGKRKCTVELPIDGPNGEPLMAEVVLSGKKKEAVIQCALEACRILDRHGLLRKATHESRKKKERNWEEDDYYDSDEDIYLDRTGTIEKKRQIRMNKVGKSGKSAETYDSLLERHTEIVMEMQEIENKLAQAKAEAAAFENEEVDALDAYMTAIKSGAMDTKTKMKLKCRLLELKQEEQKVRKLVNIAKPASLPELKVPEKKTETVKTGLLSGTGKIKGLHHKSVLKPAVPINKPISHSDDSDFVVEEEEEEDDDVEEQKLSKLKQEENKLPHKESLPDISQLKEAAEKSKSVSLNIDIKHALKADKDKKERMTELDSKIANVSDHKQMDTETSTKTSSVKGPSLPLSAVLEQLQDDSEINEDEETSLSKKRKSKDNSEPNKKTKLAVYDEADPDYAVWLPPQNQAGDGRTHLNAKFGY